MKVTRAVQLIIRRTIRFVPDLDVGKPQSQFGSHKVLGHRTLFASIPRGRQKIGDCLPGRLRGGIVYLDPLAIMILPNSLNQKPCKLLMRRERSWGIRLARSDWRRLLSSEWKFPNVPRLVLPPSVGNLLVSPNARKTFATDFPLTPLTCPPPRVLWELMSKSNSALSLSSTTSAAPMVPRAGNPPVWEYGCRPLYHAKKTVMGSLRFIRSLRTLDKGGGLGAAH